MKKSVLTLKIFSLIVLNDLSESVAQLFMKKGLVDTHLNLLNLGSIIEFVSTNITSYLVWLGIIIYTLNFLIWIIILSRLDLSSAVPLASTNYIVIPLAAMIFLHEKVSLVRWCGIGFIILGIYFVSRSSMKEKHATYKL